MKRNDYIKGYLFVIASAVIFGCMPMMAKYIYAEGVNSLSLVFLRSILSLPVLACLGYRTQKSLRISAKAFLPMSFIAVMGCCLTPLLLFSSYQFMPSGSATVFHFIYPAVVVLLNIFVLKERVSKSRLISVCICVLGISLFYTPGEPLSLTGSILALSSGITYAIYVLLLSIFKHKEVSGFVFNFYITVISSTVMLITCLALGQLFLPTSILGWGLCFLFALTVNVGAVVLFQQGTFLIGGQRASILSTLEPITSIFLGVLLFQEHIGLPVFLGSVLVITASILISRSDFKNNSKSDPQ